MCQLTWHQQSFITTKSKPIKALSEKAPLNAGKGFFSLGVLLVGFARKSQSALVLGCLNVRKECAVSGAVMWTFIIAPSLYRCWVLSFSIIFFCILGPCSYAAGFLAHQTKSSPKYFFNPSPANPPPALRGRFSLNDYLSLLLPVCLLLLFQNMTRFVAFGGWGLFWDLFWAMWGYVGRSSPFAKGSDELAPGWAYVEPFAVWVHVRPKMGVHLCPSLRAQMNTPAWACVEPCWVLYVLWDFCGGSGTLCLVKGPVLYVLWTSQLFVLWWPTKVGLAVSVLHRELLRDILSLEETKQVSSCCHVLRQQITFCGLIHVISHVLLNITPCIV